MKRHKKGAIDWLLFFHIESGLFSAGLRSGFAKGFESGLVVDGHFGKHLAVDFDSALVEAVDEAAVAEAVDAARGVDTLNPKLAVVTLDLTTGYVSVAPAVENLFLSCLEKKMFAAKIAFGVL